MKIDKVYIASLRILDMKSKGLIGLLSGALF